MQHGTYIINPLIVEAMQDKRSFLIVHDEIDGLTKDPTIIIWDIDGWNRVYGIHSPIRRMIAHHIVDHNGNAGYVLHDTAIAPSLLIPDDIIAQGYEAVINGVREAGGLLYFEVKRQEFCE